MSIKKAARVLGCSPATIRNRFNKYGIKGRGWAEEAKRGCPYAQEEIKIDKLQLRDLYLNQHIGPHKLAGLFGCSYQTIVKNLIKIEVYPATIDYKCEICGKSFQKRIGWNGLKLCSTKCRNKQNRQNRPIHKKQCQQCGRSYSTKYKPQKFCKPSCFTTSLRKYKGTERICIECDRPFEPTQSK